MFYQSTFTNTYIYLFFCCVNSGRNVPDDDEDAYEDEDDDDTYTGDEKKGRKYR